MKSYLRKLFLSSWSFWRKKSITENDLIKDAPASLLEPLSVMGNFLEMFQEI